MRRYSTIALKIDIGSDTANIDEAWITFSKSLNSRSEILTKTMSDMEKYETGFICVLTESDTAELNKLNNLQSHVFIQARVRYSDGSADTSNIIEEPIGIVLKEGLIG